MSRVLADELVSKAVEALPKSDPDEIDPIKNVAERLLSKVYGTELWHDVSTLILKLLTKEEDHE